MYRSSRRQLTRLYEIESHSLRGESPRVRGRCSFTESLSEGWNDFRRVGSSQALYHRLRASPSPSLSRHGRVFYPDNEGCIGKAWNEGSFFAGDYPDPDTALEQCLDRCAKDGMASKVARKIRMKSFLYGVYAIKDAKGQNSLAVIVVESLQAGRYTREELDAIFLPGAEPARYLGEFLDVFAKELPDIMAARLEGF